MVVDIDEGVQYKVLSWDVWRSGVPRIDDTETDAPDGSYTFRIDMFDYNQDVSKGNDYVMLGWESMLPVTVKNGNINKTEALKAAGHLIAMCGYTGRKLRTVAWKADSNYFNIGVTH